MPDVVRILVEKTVSSLLLFAVFWALFNSSEHLKGVLTRVTEKSEAHLDNIAVNYLVYALKALVIIFGGLSILQIWVGNISSLIAGLSIGGVAFALAAQDTRRTCSAASQSCSTTRLRSANTSRSTASPARSSAWVCARRAYARPTSRLS